MNPEENTPALSDSANDSAMPVGAAREKAPPERIPPGEKEYEPSSRARPFVPRGGLGKYADYKHRWYLQNRDRILRERIAARRAAPTEPTPEEKQRSHRRRSTAGKRRWKNASPKERAKILEILRAGRLAGQTKLSAQRREWDAIKLRLGGLSIKGTALKLGLGPKRRKRVRTAIRSVDLPEGKRYLCDRGKPFTRESGTRLCKALGQSYGEFAALIGVRARRPAIWLTNSSKHLDPSEAQRCMDLRDRIAKALLVQS